MASLEEPQPLQQPGQLAAPLQMYADAYEQWLTQQISEGRVTSEELLPLQQRKELLAAWLRHLVATGQLAPSGPLPTHAALGEVFALSPDQVARIVFHLRKEHVLAASRPRSDAGKPRWNDRDEYTLWWIGEQRAGRYDQVQRLLARESRGEPKDPQALSPSRTAQIIQRWQKAHLVAYRKIYVQQPGWIWLTRKGLAFVGLDYRASVPAESSLTHLYYINEVRLLLEQTDEDHPLIWRSERALHHALEQMRIKSHRLPHIPDAIATIGENQIDIEVELTRKPQQEIERTMRGAWGSAHSTHALRYYVSRQALATVQAAWKQIEHAYSAQGHRPWVEIVALDTLFKRPEQRRD